MLGGIDDIQAVLDDSIVKTQAIRSSPFSKPFEAEVQDWERKLLYMQDFVDYSLSLQRAWMALEPIFQSEDIKRQLPKESEDFAVVDEMFRRRSTQICEAPNCVQMCSVENAMSTPLHQD